MNTNLPTKETIEARLIEEASQNPDFRQRLLEDPKTVLSAFLGIALPPGMTITVLEEAPGRHYLILPPAPPSLDALPLDELDLALVGGGRTMRPGQALYKEDVSLSLRGTTATPHLRSAC